MEAPHEIIQSHYSRRLVPTTTGQEGAVAGNVATSRHDREIQPGMPLVHSGSRSRWAQPMQSSQHMVEGLGIRSLRARSWALLDRASSRLLSNSSAILTVRSPELRGAGIGPGASDSCLCVTPAPARAGEAATDAQQCQARTMPISGVQPM